MRFLFTADWHVHPFRECSRDGGQDRLQDGLSAVRQLLQAARDRRCPLVVGGDVKHTPGHWILSVLNGLLALFEEFRAVPKVLIHGNHDGVAGGRSGLEIFRSSDVLNCAVLSAPCVTTWGTLDGGSGDGTPVAIWPWQRSLDGLPAFLTQAKKAKARVLFAHAFLSGATVGPAEVRLAKGTSLEQFGLAGKSPVFSWGLFGDVHKAQALPGNVAGVRGVWYPGSLYSQTWGERETDKGALDVDLDRGVAEIFPIRAPRFIVTDWSDIQDANRYLTANLSAPGALFDSWRGNFVRLLVSPRVDGKLLEQVREASGARAFQVIVQRESRVEQRVDVHAGLDPGELLSRYVQARPPGDGLDPRAILAAGQKLLAAAK